MDRRKPTRRLERPKSPPLPHAVEEKLKKRPYRPQPIGTSGRFAKGETKLRIFSDLVRAGFSPVRRDLEWVAQAFELILSGVDAYRALELQIGKGNVTSQIRHRRNCMMAAEIDALRQEWGRGSSERSVEYVARRWRVTVETTRNNYKRLKRVQREIETRRKERAESAGQNYHPIFDLQR